ncbi:protein unc-45 homolog A [Elysia marginata]|uniref:Protein unc-45 homolog A n=1 Tax=Elysia marginata TaxID=1093978 RepID=A0AAV4GAS0_9GAST|nr:protein unc-45 homolog A [Elysia marginata]
MNNTTDAGSVLAAHALAKISVTSDPHFAFPGQRVEPWLDILQVHAVSEKPDIQHRACHVLANVACASRECAQKLAESPVMEVLSAVATDTRDPRAKLAKEAAQRALDQCIEFGLIKENTQGKNPVHFLDILRAQLRKAREEEERKRKLEEEEEKRRKEQEEEDRKKREEEFEKNQADAERRGMEEEDEGEVEEIEVERAEASEQQGPKIRELTEDEIARLELEERLRVPPGELKEKDTGGAASKVVKVEDVEARSGHSMGSSNNAGNSGGGGSNVRDSSRSEDSSKGGGGGGDKDGDLDEEELDRGDVWNDEAGLS